MVDTTDVRRSELSSIEHIAVRWFPTEQFFQFERIETGCGEHAGIPSLVKFGERASGEGCVNLRTGCHGSIGGTTSEEEYGDEGKERGTTHEHVPCRTGKNRRASTLGPSRTKSVRWLTMLLGAHVDRAKVLAAAEATGSDVVQIFLSAPLSWAAPRESDDERVLRDSGLVIFVHAPYLLNPASINPEVRNKTRRALIAQGEAAARIGAAGLVVHGGHPTGEGDVRDGIAGWVDVLHDLHLPVRLLIENTAGGKAAVARSFDAFAALYGALHEAGHDIGVCLDTCHAHAGGEELVHACERLRSFAGTIDLVHANDSRDPFNSGRDRHANLGAGACGLEAVAHVVAEAGCPAVVETPGGTSMMRDDIMALRTQVAS